MRDISGKQRAVLLQLLNGRTRREAATEAGVSEATVYRYLAEPGFRAVLRDKQNDIFVAAIEELQSMSAKANCSLKRALDCGHAPTETRAALGIHALALKALELQVLTRLERLEEDLGR